MSFKCCYCICPDYFLWQLLPYTHHHLCGKKCSLRFPLNLSPSTHTLGFLLSLSSEKDCAFTQSVSLMIISDTTIWNKKKELMEVHNGSGGICRSKGIVDVLSWNLLHQDFITASDINKIKELQMQSRKTCLVGQAGHVLHSQRKEEEKVEKTHKLSHRWATDTEK